jgi:tyrosyl-tRNA synthetase
MCAIGMTSSAGEARRLLQQGAVYLDDEKITDAQAVITPRAGLLLRAGKRRVMVLVRVE